MSRLIELLSQAWSSSVQSIALGEVARESSQRNRDASVQEVRSVTNTVGLVRTTDFFDNARTSTDTRNYKVVSPGAFVYNPSRINVGSLGWLDEPDPVIVSPMYVVFELDSHRVEAEYLMLFLRSRRGRRAIESKTEVGARFRLTFASLGQIVMPLPSLELQREIVGAMRLFTDLESALEGEIDLRRLQFDHYRSELFRLGDEVPRRPLGECGTFIRGRRFSKVDYVDDGIPCLHYGEIYTSFGTSTTTVISAVRDDMAASLRYAESGDVVLTDVGETVEDVGKAVAWLGDGKVAIHDHCYAFRSELEPRYVAHYMSSSEFLARKSKHVARTKVKTLLIPGFSRLTIPVPSLETQRRIADALDRFEALIADERVGLPAELAARREQYEYYRDRLLTFEGATA